MNARDWEYIENRLLAPAVGASEGLERLRLQPAFAPEASALESALTRFQAECRIIRADVRTRQTARPEGRAL